MERRERLLIVDDNEDLIQNLSEILELKGYKVSVCLDGYKAIEKVKKEKFDLIFMDIRMPGINGVETFKRIRKISPGTITIMITAYSMEDMVKEALTQGAYDILYKPLDMEGVFAIIERAFKERKGRLVLIVDDDDNILYNLKDILQEKGCSVLTANSGDKAVELARTNPFAVVFIDIKLPVLNGLEVYKTIKKINPRICAVMMTGYRKEVHELVEEALDSSAYTCINKPLDIDILLNIVNNIFMDSR